MFENFHGLIIKGKCFQDEADLKFFDTNHHRFCLIYGKNGSGKSTISQAFNAIKFDKSVFNINKILDENNQEIQITQEQKKKIFVFNEKYIDEKIKLKDNGLDTIILLGEAVDIDNKLQKLQKIYDSKIKRKDKYEKILTGYENDQNTDNPKKYENQIVEILKDKFADREKEILGRQRKDLHNKTIEFAKNIMKNYATQTSKDILQNDFDQKLSEYQSVRSEVNFENPIQLLDITDINNLLLYQVKQKPLNQEQMQIKEIIENDEISRNIMKSDKELCPYCFQKLTNEYKKEILNILENIFNKDIQNHKNELEIKKTQIENLLDDLKIVSQMDILDNELFNNINSQIKKYQEHAVLKINKKINSVFVSISLDENFNDIINDINANLQQLEQKRQKFQAQKLTANELKSELERLNSQIAFYEINQDFNDYEEKLKYKEYLEYKNNHNDARLNFIKKLLSRLNSQKEQANIAQNKINQHLKYIFFKDDRLQLSYLDEQKQYMLQINGNSVKAKDISNGERNAIALSYFFTEIFSNENELDIYKNPKFIVIDDPISSFDFENKVGVMSFLNYQIQNIINGCKNSKIIVLTHDLMSMFDLQKIGKTIFNKYKNFSQFELKNNVLENFGENYNYSEYKTLLNKIYNYAKNSQQSDNSTNIGNDMRKLLEAFGTFNYQCGIEKIATDETITSKLSPTQKTYFSNLMYRLVLHGESHMEDKTKILDFTSYISETEKQNTAKDILSLLYLLHDTHLKKYLHKEQIKSIEEWVKSCNIY
ncbi:AAA family ATPase [Campylobacter majalis]|uniref:AAA family ATPase n=1 Tax=Campylobacter majalis TaxID=2790656 RepID=UPI003D683711